MMVEPSVDFGEGGCSTSGRAIDGLDSAVEHLGFIGVGVELHFFCSYHLSCISLWALA